MKHADDSAAILLLNNAITEIGENNEHYRILAELYRKVYAGECSLTDRIALTDEVKSLGSGVLERLSAGLELSLKDYATLMMVLSDNTATDVLFDFVGRDNIRKNVLEPLGLTNTKCDLPCKEMVDRMYGLNGGGFRELFKQNGGDYPDNRYNKWFTCEAEENNQTTPLEIAKMLEVLYRGEWVCPEASSEMLKLMLSCQDFDRMKKYLPPLTLAARKPGAMDRFTADVGIVYDRKAGDYILCMFYNGNLADEKDYEKNIMGYLACEYLAQLSRDIYNAHIET